VSHLLILSGAGLSAASGVPTFRDANGLWEGYEVTEVATPEAWRRNPTLVRRFYDERRAACAAVLPNPGHTALARLQTVLGPDRVTLVTQNIDGLLSKAGAPQVTEMHGSLWHLRCEATPNHPKVPVAGSQDPAARCASCGAPLRPDVVWFGEEPYDMEHILRRLATADRFISVGTSGLVYPAAGFGQIAHRRGIPTLDVNPDPARAPWFDEVVREGSEIALPRLVEGWLAGD
jgi:NAD-dependent deacetylase